MQVMHGLEVETEYGNLYTILGESHNTLLDTFSIVFDKTIKLLQESNCSSSL